MRTRELLGGISNGTYYQLKKNPRTPGKSLDQDKLVRISFLIGIFKSLNILYSQRLADQWMQLPTATRSSPAARRWITSCVEGRRPWT